MKGGLALADPSGVYGRLHIATDTRGFRNEAQEEIEDALVFACAWLKGERRPPGEAPGGRPPTSRTDRHREAPDALSQGERLP